jgi:predicted metalloenzyme YecM
MGLDETGWWASNRFRLKKSTSDKLFSQIPHNETNVLTKYQVPHSSIKIVNKQQAKYVYVKFQTYGIWIFHE